MKNHTVCTSKCRTLPLSWFVHAHNLHVKKSKLFTRKFSQPILKNQLGFITTSAIKLCFKQRQGWYSLTFINFQENYQTAEIYFHSYHVIPFYQTICYHFVNQLLPNLIPWPLQFRLKLHIFTNKIKYVSITIITLKGQACIMFLT